MKIKLVILDMDGVLINSKKMYVESSKKVLEKLGINPDENKIEKYLWMKVSDFYDKQIPLELPNREKTIAKAIELDNKMIKSKNMEDMVELIPSAFKGLNYLKEKDIHMAIVTNARRNIAERDLKKFKITDYIKEILTCSDGLPIKPNPDQLIEIMRKFNVSKQETVYIGDSSNDIKTGKNAGVTTIGIYGGWYPKKELEKENPDYLIENLGKINEVIQ